VKNEDSCGRAKELRSLLRPWAFALRPKKGAGWRPAPSEAMGYEGKQLELRPKLIVTEWRPAVHPDRTRKSASARPEVSANHATADRVQHDFGSTVKIQFFHDVRAMRLDRARADAQQRRNFLVRLRFGDQLKDLALTF
jgi:hypothetical protein